MSRGTVRSLSLLLSPLLVLAALMVGSGSSFVGASSHREAPLIASDPDADNTDVYAFISPDANDSVTIVANWIPLEQPEGGPNFHKFSDTVLYEIHIDNVGDARSRITYQFEFTNTTRNANTFLYNTGPITSLTDEDFNVRTTYNVTEVISPTSGSIVSKTLGSNFPVPPVNIGSKSTPDYEPLADAAIRSVTDGPDTMKIFAGPRDDPFFVDLGSVFDLLSLRGQAPPVGYPPGPTMGVDGVAGYNTHSIVLQIPIRRLLATAPANETVIGVWATSSRRSTRVLNGVAGVLDGRGFETHSGDFVQVSRLGMPLVNEVVIPRALKDAFNNLKPEQDASVYTSNSPVGTLLRQSVLDPELQRLLKALYNVPNPGNNRLDIQEIFLTGIKTNKPFTIQTANGPVELPAGTNVNQPQNVQPSEMIRLNTALPFRPGTPNNICAPTPNYQLGLLGGDACGFPNGRRLQDDATDIELLAVAGAAYSVITDETFAFDRALVKVLTDSVSENDRPLRTTFPYVATPHQGQEHFHEGLMRTFLPFVTAQPERHGGERAP